MIEAALLLPLAVVLARFLWAERRYRVTYVDLFNVGFFVYVSLPLLFAISEQLRVLPLVEHWQALVLGLSSTRFSWLIWFAPVCWIAFELGVGLGLLLTPRLATHSGQVRQHPLVVNSTICILGGLLTLYSLAHIFRYRALLFAGYSDPEYSQAARGPLQLAMLLIFYLLAFGIERRDRVSRRVLWLLGGAALLIAAASLSMGTRQGLVTVMLATAVFVSTLFGGVRRGTFVLIAGVLVTLLAFVGVWRLGAGQGMLVTAAFEPMGTFISALTMVSFNDIPALAVPDELAIGLLNLIPTALWPDKLEYMSRFAPDLTFVAPLGAQHLFVSLVSAFGWVGSLAFLLASGVCLQLFSARCVATRTTGSYAIVAAVFAMDIWRNPLSITLVKICLQAAFLWPIAVHLTSRGIEWLLAPDLGFSRSDGGARRDLHSEAV